MIRWDQPWLLVMLLLIPLAVWASRRPVSRPAAVLWTRVNALGSRLGVAVLRTVDALPWIALALAGISLARPQQGVRQSETETRGVDIIVAIDISPSMAAEDFRPLNRLHVAKQTAREFIRQRKHDRVGVVAFAATAFTQCPLTLDKEALLELVDALDFGLAADGTAIGMGLATAVAGLKDSQTPSKVVVLMTDGENNRGQIDPLTAAELAKSFGVKVHTVLVGRGGVVPVPIDDPLLGRRVEMVQMDVDPETLTLIAQRTGGNFFRAQDPSALAGVYAEIDRLERAPIKSIEFREYRDVGPWLLAAAALVLLAHGVFGATWAVRLP